MFNCTFVLLDKQRRLSGVIKHYADVLNWISENATRQSDAQKVDTAVPLSWALHLVNGMFPYVFGIDLKQSQIKRYSLGLQLKRDPDMFRKDLLKDVFPF